MARKRRLGDWLKDEILDDVGVRFEFLEDGDFPHRGGWHSLVFIFEFDFFKSNYLLGSAVASLVNHSICSLADRL